MGDFELRITDLERRVTALEEPEGPEFPQKRLRRAIDEAKERGIPFEEAQQILLEAYQL